MPLKEWISDYEGNEIRVSNTWLGGARLYINGEMRDKTTDLFAVAGKRPLLSTRMIRDDPTSPLVEVYIKAIFTVKAKILVNGRFLTGEKF